MDQSDDDSAFSFGSVEDTLYENMNEEVEIGKLPYNPFLFDLTLVLKESAQGYEHPGLEIELSNNSTNVFGRRPKKKNQQTLQSQLQTRHYFLAQTMSKNHFSISADHQLSDMSSKKGTYLWLNRNSPKLLQVGDQFLLNCQPIKIQSINKQTQKIQIQLTQTLTLTLNPKLFKQRLFLIGSSSRCHFVMKGLELYHLGIDLLGLTLHNLIEEEDCGKDKGTWIKVNEEIKVEGGDFIMTYPYVFEVRY